MQEGKYVGRLIRARLAGKSKTKPFAYRDKGGVATMGTYRLSPSRPG